MNVVRCTTKNELRKAIFKIIFGNEDLAFEEICDLLQIEETDLVDPNIPQYSDEWWEVTDKLEIKDLRRYVRRGNVYLLANFKPGVLVYWIENDFDRFGNVKFRFFEYYTDEAINFSEWDKK